MDIDKITEIKRKGQYSLAEHYYRIALKDNLDSKDLWNGLLEVCFLQGKKETTKKLIEEIKQKFEKNYYPYHIEYTIKLNEESEDVEIFFEQCENDFRNDVIFQYDKFIYYSEKRKNNEAIEIAENYLVNNDKIYSRIALDLSNIYISNNEYEKAIEVLLRAFVLSNDFLFVPSVISIYTHIDDIENALKYCDILSESNNTLLMLEARLFRCILDKSINQKNNELQRIIEECMKMDISYPLRINIDLLLVVAYYCNKEFDKAIDRIDFIENICGGATEETAHMRRLINNDSQKTDVVESLDIYILKDMLKMFYS